ncbi:sugar ABC transporter permease [Microbacterium sp. NEAU-LLC]|uniref:Sugar ABC transporter permease n=1 Tax=Microbacterium helvum TaxID=2773713 RepID=A0ABR8NT37_9MICO|nr:sugar ABC transporter permease [Microbacterium helvum]MBD3943607.1 sugar ABC transporter permease [Microbacterium helvum]
MTALITAAEPGERVTSPRPRRPPRRPNFDRISFLLVFLVAPLALFVAFVLWPFAQSAYYALTSWGGYTADLEWVGLQNFTQMLSDEVLLKSLRNSVVLALVVPTLTLGIAFAIACVVTTGGPSIGTIQGLRGSAFYRVASFFPYCVPAIVIGIIWAQVYDPSRGLLNGILTAVGLDQFRSFPWLGDETTAMAASVLVIVWSLIGFYTILFIAAIKGIPAETYEAARLDGAGRFRIAVSVTLPQILSSFQTAYIYVGLVAVDSFVYMAALNNQGGPNYSTLTMTQYLYNVAFFQGKFGYATAIGIVLALVTLIYAALVFGVFRLLRGKDGGDHA